MSSSSSVDASITVEEAGSTESSILRASLAAARQQMMRTEDPQIRLRDGNNSTTPPLGVPSGVGFHRDTGLPPVPPRQSASTTSPDEEDDMADRVLHTLERKDALLAEQARCLQHRDEEAAQLRREIATFEEEKRLLAQQVRSLIASGAHTSGNGNDSSSNLKNKKSHNTSGNGGSVGDDGRDASQRISDIDMKLLNAQLALKDERIAEQASLLRRMEQQLDDERSGRQQDTSTLREHIAQLTTQLAKSRHEAQSRERRHVADLENVQREMTEVSTLVEEAQSAKAALRRAESQLTDAVEEQALCRTERDRLVRALQDALCRERAERQKECAALRQQLETTVTAHHRTLKAMQEASEERSNLQAALRQESDTVITLRRELETQQTALLSLRKTEGKRHAALSAGVAECVEGTAALEEALRRANTNARDAHTAREETQTALRQREAAAREERMEQQRLLSEMQNFYTAHLQAMRREAEGHRERADALERDAALTATMRTALEESLDRERRRGAEAAESAVRERRRAESAFGRVEAEKERRCVAERRAESAEGLAEERLGMLERRRATETALRTKLQRALERERVGASSGAHSHHNHRGEATPPNASHSTRAGGEGNTPPLDGWRERLRAAEYRVAALEKQLHATQHSHRAALAAQREAERRAQASFETLERRHRESMRRLEAKDREAITAAATNGASKSVDHQAMVRRAISRVVAEIMAFLRAVENFALETTQHMIATANLEDATHDGEGGDAGRVEEDAALLAACDDIAREFLGIEGGWDALQKRPKTSTQLQPEPSRLPPATRRRVHSLLVAYLEAQFLPSTSATAPTKTIRRHGGLSVSFVDEESVFEGERDGGQPLAGLLMECVRSAFGFEE